MYLPSLIVAALLASAAVPAQELLWQREGTGPPRSLLVWFNNRVVPGRDVDRDGWDDLFTRVQVYERFYTGIWVLSGKDGSTLRILTVPFPWVESAYTSAGDMDSDGRGDYVVTLFKAEEVDNRVQVRSAWDDRLLWEVRGRQVESFGQYPGNLLGDIDVDGDGRPDVLVGAARANPVTNSGWRGQVNAYSNRGNLLYSLVLPQRFRGLGWSLAKVGDVDRDGCEDYCAGAYDNDALLGSVVLLSGKTGKLLVTGYGESSGVLGYNVLGCGDLDGDGVPDFLGSTSGGFGQRGLVRAFSSTTGKAIHTWVAPTSYQYQNGFGDNIAGGYDLDGDGVPDLLIWANPAASGLPNGAVFAYSGRDGQRMAAILNRLNGVTAMRPQPGSPFGLIIAHEPDYNGEMGRITLYRGLLDGIEAYGFACRGTLAAQPHIGIRSLDGKATRIHLAGAPSGTPALLLLGLSRTRLGGYVLPMPLTAFGFPQCFLRTSADVLLAAQTGTSGLAAGYASIDLPWPPTSKGSLTLYGQWVALGTAAHAPGGVTEALSWRH